MAIMMEGGSDAEAAIPAGMLGIMSTAFVQYTGAFAVWHTGCMLSLCMITRCRTRRAELLELASHDVDTARVRMQQMENAWVVEGLCG